jgi:hypothetical protein
MAAVNHNWSMRRRGDAPIESRLSFDRHTLIVHRHKDEAADQWLYSCHTLGVERVLIGQPGDSIETARHLAVAELQRDLLLAYEALRKAAP